MDLFNDLNFTSLVAWQPESLQLGTWTFRVATEVHMFQILVLNRDLIATVMHQPCISIVMSDTDMYHCLFYAWIDANKPPLFTAGIIFLVVISRELKS